MKTISKIKYIIVVVMALITFSCSKEDSASEPRDTQGTQDLPDQGSQDGGNSNDQQSELKSPKNGDLIITEIMFDPNAVSDNDGEWFEIYNLSEKDTFNLKEISFFDTSNAFTIDSELLILPKSYLVLGKNMDSTQNGNVTVDYQYQNLSLPNNSESKITIQGIDQEMIFEIIFSGETFDSGKSLNLSSASLSMEDASMIDNWCLSSNELDSGDFGTPGGENANCQ